MDQRNVVMKDYKNSQWIKSCEESFAKQIYDITESIAKKQSIRVIRLFGPSCSGKTTTARHLISFLKSLEKGRTLYLLMTFSMTESILENFL